MVYGCSWADIYDENVRTCGDTRHQTASNPSWSKARVFYGAKIASRTPSFYGNISYSQVIYDAYIALGERRTAASHSIPVRSYIHVVAYF